MMLIFGLMLLQTAACLELNCGFDQSDPCYTALGHKLNLMMVQDASKYDLTIIKRINNNTADGSLCRVKYGRMRKSQCDLYNNRTEVTVINGTLIINRVNRADSGNYRLTLFHSDGSETSRDLQVIVEAPIGSVEVSIICSSSGVMRVFCSSEGDQLLYSWTLNGDPLMDGNSSIDLDEGTDGDISCSVKNHVSHAQKTIRLKPCPGLDRLCSFDQSDPCYTSLGHKLNLMMVQDASKYDLKIQKRINNNTADGPVCRVKNDRMRTGECDLYNNRPEVTVINGSLIINRVNRADSGNYRLTLESSDGTETSRDLQVIVEGLELNCSFDQSDPCYTALGHKLNLMMVQDASKYDLQLKKRINNNTADGPLCRVKNGRMRTSQCDLYNNRPEVTVINGSLIINRVIRTDSGNYRLTLSHSDGSETSRDLQVIVEAPIGSVEVSIICSSSGVMRVFCSSEGDQLLYSWTLNGDPLMDGNSSIDLDEGTDGDISCSVKNHVSHAQKTIRLKPCPGLDRLCSFDQSDPCYTALGHKLNLMMVQDASKYDLKIQKRINNNTADGPVCRVKNDRMRTGECDLYNNRPEVTVINGMLIINRVNRTDSGNYRLTLESSDGTETSRDLQVIVEAPIGSVEVSIICSSSGVMRVFCSSEGDQLLYSWTLNGDPLMDGNSSIDLDEGTDGDISCSVKNHVSHAQKTIRLKPCPGLDQFCSFDQSDPCYTALGHKLNLLMVQDASKYDLMLTKRINYTQDDPVCRVKNGRMRMNQCDLYNNRPEVTVTNGSLIINRVIRADSGNYRLRISHSDGTETSRDLQVIVEGLELNCGFDQSDPCYTALGHKLNLMMVQDASKYDLTIIKRINNNTADGPVCRVRYGRMRKSQCDLYNNRTEVTVTNGTVIINRVIRADSGNYTLKLTLSDGTDTSRDLPVIVEAPIGSVEVSIICSSNQTSVFCSSEGDQIIYSWTLNGKILEGPMFGNSSIDLDEGTDGDISCSVKNHVSHAQKTIRLKPCPGLDQFCRFDQSDPCYTALGHKLHLMMVQDASKYDLKIIKRINNKKDGPVCRVKNDKMRKTECDLYNNRPEVTVINGTVIINRVNTTDSGNYRLKLSLSDGTETSRDLQVIVEAPIGSVNVSIICSSNQTSVFCSSEGDQLLYSWTLNGDPLMDGNSSIDLDGETEGNISCSVKNHVSHAQKTIRLKPCPEPTTAAVTSSATSSATSSLTSSLTSSVTSEVTSSSQTSENGTSFSSAGTNITTDVISSPKERWKYLLFLIALGCAAVTLILLFIIVCCVYKKKQQKSITATAGDTELIYTDISPGKKDEKKKTETLPAGEEEYAAVRPQTKRKKNEEEEEVQYGEVTFTPNQSVAPQQSYEECVYAQVQRR
ncbi:uncharacterized protein LOC127971498 isoform X3 [Carassius gibelio]|uniref:uncharacterized protein LOC127971498 isoform X2 n=1 Tax=Carassius gibelio TaxID=101364 RepID=UPI0022786751|nr:uncharacterized protein LOC127971498 isoform X2 [Carassius gibelio]XP_052430493.1 uncharacterized protein LOC127971498 isoform X3 [Carassius gibelio]XP_052430494.1 uncharacterized protein LOC127971498 isoform X3 [Carassius gibelio]